MDSFLFLFYRPDLQDFEDLFSDGVGLSFLIFFWKMRNQKDPVNPVNPV